MQFNFPLDAKLMLSLMLMLVTVFIRSDAAARTGGAWLYPVSAMIVMYFCSTDTLWLKSFLYMLIVIFIIHLILGYFLWLNPHIISDKLIFLYKLDAKNYIKCLRMLRAGFMLGITSHYSTMGMITAIGCISVFSYFRYLSKSKYNGIFLIIISFVALALTGKRAHLLFTCLSIVITYYRFFKKINLTIILRIGLAVAVILTLFLLFRNTRVLSQIDVTIERFLITDDMDANEISTGRIEHLWIPAIDLFLTSPIIGIGWGEFYPLHGNHVHNVYLQLLCETGIIGFAIFFIFFIRTLILTYQDLKKVEMSAYKQYLSFSLTMQLFFLMYCFTGNPLYDAVTCIPYFVSCAMTYSVHKSKNTVHRDLENGIELKCEENFI
jgi:hypothetical protein